MVAIKENHPFISRLLVVLIMGAVIAWGYWWLILGIGLIFLFVFDPYYEVIIWGACFDALYASPQQNTSLVEAHIGLIFAIILLLGTIFIKKRLAFYS